MDELVPGCVDDGVVVQQKLDMKHNPLLTIIFLGKYTCCLIHLYLYGKKAMGQNFLGIRCADLCHKLDMVHNPLIIIVEYIALFKNIFLRNQTIN